MATVIRQENIAPKSASVPDREGPGHDAEFRSALSWLLPDPIRRHGGRIETLQQPLLETEALLVRNAVERRVMEFTAGRACAHAVLGELGLAGVPVGMGPRREPLWPSGTVGSISHAAGFCVAAAGTRDHMAGLGVDIECASALPETLTDLVCTPAERRWCEGQSGLSAGLLAKFVFSAKEAVFKCLYPVFGEELDFMDVTLELDMQAGRFIARVSRLALNTDADLELHGRVACTSRLAMTSALLLHSTCEWLHHGYGLRRLADCEGQYICN
ncbi:MAG TPA: 4'-phosphopantetheinyl transferase superfamily protein [Gammaproteobacteria bacterium]